MWDDSVILPVDVERLIELLNGWDQDGVLALQPGDGRRLAHDHDDGLEEGRVRRPDQDGRLSPRRLPPLDRHPEPGDEEDQVAEIGVRPHHLFKSPGFIFGRLARVESYIKIRGKNPLHIFPQMVKMYNWPIECVCLRVNRRKENILPLFHSTYPTNSQRNLFQNKEEKNKICMQPCRNILTASHDWSWCMTGRGHPSTLFCMFPIVFQSSQSFHYDHTILKSHCLLRKFPLNSLPEPYQKTGYYAVFFLRFTNEESKYWWCVLILVFEMLFRLLW